MREARGVVRPVITPLSISTPSQMQAREGRICPLWQERSGVARHVIQQRAAERDLTQYRENDSRIQWLRIACDVQWEEYECLERRCDCAQQSRDELRVLGARTWRCGIVLVLVFAALSMSNVLFAGGGPGLPRHGRGRSLIQWATLYAFCPYERVTHFGCGSRSQSSAFSFKQNEKPFELVRHTSEGDRVEAQRPGDLAEVLAH